MTPPLSVMQGGPDAIARWVAEQTAAQARRLLDNAVNIGTDGSVTIGRPPGSAPPPAANVVPATGIVPAVPGIFQPSQGAPFALPPLSFDFGPDEWFQMSAEATNQHRAEEEESPQSSADSRNEADASRASKKRPTKKRRKKAVKTTGKAKPKKRPQKRGSVDQTFID